MRTNLRLRGVYRLVSSARKEWKRVAPLLADKGLLSEVDRAALVGYVVAWSNLRKAFESAKANGMILEYQGFDKNGKIKASKVIKRPR